MKYLIPAFLLTLSLNATAQTLTLKVTNPSSIDRKDEPVALKFNDQKSIKGEVTAAYVKGEKGIVPSQLDDLNGDLRYDELFFVTDIPAHTTQTFTITLNADTPEAAAVKQALESSPRIYTALQLRDKKDLHPDVRRVEAAGSSNVFNDIYNSIIFNNIAACYMSLSDNENALRFANKSISYVRTSSVLMN